MKVRRKVDPEKWPLPGLAMLSQTPTDFSQLINCAEFVPRQPAEEPRGERSLRLTQVRRADFFLGRFIKCSLSLSLQALPGPPSRPSSTGVNWTPPTSRRCPRASPPASPTWTQSAGSRSRRGPDRPQPDPRSARR